MLEFNSSETQPSASSPRRVPEMMPAFISRHSAFFTLTAVLVAQLLLLAFQVTGKHNVRLIKLWTVAAFDPFERSVQGLVDSVSGTWTSYHDLRQAQRENEILKAQLAKARAKVIELSEEGLENVQLRAILGLQQRLPLRSKGATVIAVSPGASAAVFIDKGTLDGLSADMPVITPEGVAGKVVAVFPRSAQVLLITDRSSGAGCMIEKTGAEGVLKGGGNGFCHLDYIMNDEKVKPGDIVVTSGLDQIYPKGLLVGTVVKVTDGDIYKNIRVKPAAALDRLEDVLVIVGPSSRHK